LKPLAHRSAALAVALVLVFAFAAPAFAQSSLLPKPWRPATADSITQWAIEGRNLLAESNNPELGDREVVAYRWVDKVAKAYFHSLGPHGMAAAGGLSAFLDTLKLKGSVVSDKVYPAFSFVLFSNPSHENYASLGYLYWFRGDEVRSQPIYLKGGHDPDLRVWWTGREQAPWEMGLLYTMERDRDQAPEFIFMRMIPSGAGWEPVQAGVDVDFGGKGTATFADLDGDGTPEIVSWVHGVPDTLFVPCNDTGCPELLTERIFTLERGYELYDQRTVATPYATLVLFVRSLVGGKEGIAQSLVTQPSVIEKARALGWPKLRHRGAFRALAPRGNTRWPDRLRFEYGPQGKYDSLLEVRFASSQGHWLIDDIVTLTSGGAEEDTTRSATTTHPPTHAPAHTTPHKSATTPPKGAKAGGR
jgi:hypothetical protein